MEKLKKKSDDSGVFNFNFYFKNMFFQCDVFSISQRSHKLCMNKGDSKSFPALIFDSSVNLNQFLDLLASRSLQKIKN